MVMEAAQEWQKCTSIIFKFLELDSTDSAHINITFWRDEEVPPEFTPTGDYNGHWSLLRQFSSGRRPSINFNLVPLLNECEAPDITAQQKVLKMKFIRATILHEIGHALGFIHEQLRGDRDKAFKLNVEDIVTYYNT